MKILATLLITLVTWTSLNAKAEVLPLPTYNLSDKAVWITVYNLATGSQADWGCLPARSMRTWWSGNYLPVLPYYIVAEVKSTADCSGPNIGRSGSQIQLPTVAWLDTSFQWHSTPLPPAPQQIMDLEQVQ